MYTLQRYYHNFFVILGTFNEYHWLFLTCGAQISYKTNTVGRSVVLGEHLGIISNAAVSSTNFRQPSQSLMMG